MRDLKIYYGVFFLLISTLVNAQVDEFDIKAAFVERFTRFIEWPESNEENKKEESFKIFSIGANSFGDALDRLFKTAKIKNRNVEIIYTNNINEIENANLLFINSMRDDQLKEILGKIKNKPILTISDSKGFAKQGVHINMVIESDYIRYEINQEALNESGLKVNSLLLASAKIVKTN